MGCLLACEKTRMTLMADCVAEVHPLVYAAPQAVHVALSSLFRCALFPVVGASFCTPRAVFSLAVHSGSIVR